MRVRPKTLARAKSLRRNLTEAEAILWSRLNGRQLLGRQFRKQHPIGPYIADFACADAKLVVELDGATHSTPDELAHDEVRRRFIEGRGWTILRFWNSEVYQNLYGVLSAISDVLPPPSR